MSTQLTDIGILKNAITKSVFTAKGIVIESNREAGACSRLQSELQEHRIKCQVIDFNKPAGIEHIERILNSHQEGVLVIDNVDLSCFSVQETLLNKVMRDQAFTHAGVSVAIPEHVLLVLVSTTLNHDVRSSHVLTNEAKDSEGVPILNEKFAQSSAFIVDDGGSFLKKLGEGQFLSKNLKFEDNVKVAPSIKDSLQSPTNI